MIVDGQLHGGIAQGVGQALWEGASTATRASSCRARCWTTRCRGPRGFPNFELDETVTPVAGQPARRQGRRRGRRDREHRRRRERRHRRARARWASGISTCRSRPRPCGGRSSPRREARHDPGSVRLPAAGHARRGAAASSAATADKVIAGGMSLLPLMKLRLASAERLVDIGRLEELKGVRQLPDGRLAIGALTTYAELQRVAAGTTGCSATRCRASATSRSATAAPSAAPIAHCDPASDLPAVAARPRCRGRRPVDARRAGLSPLDGFFGGRSRPALRGRRDRRRDPAAGPRDDAGSAYAAARAARIRLLDRRRRRGRRRERRRRSRKAGVALTGRRRGAVPGEGRRGRAGRHGRARPRHRGGGRPRGRRHRRSTATSMPTASTARRWRWSHPTRDRGGARPARLTGDRPSRPDGGAARAGRRRVAVRRAGLVGAVLARDLRRRRASAGRRAGGCRQPTSTRSPPPSPAVGAVTVIVLEAGDLHEDDAALRLAAAVAGPGLTAAARSRAGSTSSPTHAGVLHVRSRELERLNRIDPLEVFTRARRLDRRGAATSSRASRSRRTSSRRRSSTRAPDRAGRAPAAGPGRAVLADAGRRSSSRSRSGRPTGRGSRRASGTRSRASDRRSSRSSTSLTRTSPSGRPCRGLPRPPNSQHNT